MTKSIKQDEAQRTSFYTNNFDFAYGNSVFGARIRRWPDFNNTKREIQLFLNNKWPPKAIDRMLKNIRGVGVVDRARKTLKLTSELQSLVNHPPPKAF